MRRLFVACPISEELKKEIETYQRSLTKLPLRPTPASNLHLTLVFLGVTPEEEIPGIEKKIQSVLSPLNPNSYFLTPQKFEPGPDPRFLSLIWLTLQASPEFLELQKELASALRCQEKRPFTPHITIARLRSNSRLYADQIEPESIKEDMPFEVKEVYLMESKLKPSGVEYSIVKKYYLNPNAKI